jgi:endonuclease G
MNADRKFLVRVKFAMQEAVHRWIYDPNVMLIDFGWRLRSGQLVKNELTIRVHVIEKYPPGPMLEAAIEEGKTHGPIPDTIQGFPVDRPVGTYHLQRWFNDGWQQYAARRAWRTNPMQGGISISDAARNIYATLGGLVQDRETHHAMILSNWHVLVGNWGVQPGLPIFQPGRADGGSVADIVANYSRHAMSDGFDAAVAELTGDRKLINEQLELGPIRGVSWAELGMEVLKSGRRTAVTRGLVTAVEGTIRLNYRGVDRLIRNVVTIEPRQPFREVSAGGDSGSFWCQESTMNVVALHFAGTNEPERALAIDIQPVLDALNVDIVI